MTTANPGRLAAQTSHNGILWQLGVVIATVATIIVNALANTLPLNGQETGDVSDRFSVYFVPAPYVFSIWGVIYFGLLAYTVYQALPSRRDNAKLRAVAPWYLLTAFANIAWIFAWHYNQFALSLVFMLVLLGSLIVIYRRLAAEPPATRTEFWSLHIPFSIYLGWISVATIANATSLLDYVGWNGFGISEALWGAIMLVIATVLGLFFALRRADIAYVAVLVWAFAGIAVRHSATSLVAVTAAVAAAVLVAALVVAFLRSRKALAA